MAGRMARTGAVLFAVLALACVQGIQAGRYRDLLDETQKQCQPEQLPEDQRCSYVLSHRSECAPRSGLLDYLAIYYCWGLQYWDALAALLVVAWIGFLFLLMFTASDRFFCPAMELLSEYLRLSPAVAGATLLALGNGAPDVFTQIAAASSGGGGDGGPISLESLSMALSEPLGTGLFVGNVVLGLTVAMARGLTQHVDLKPSFFLKDVLFYLGSVALVFCAMLSGYVHLWQCLLLMCGWVSYVILTIYLSKGEDVVQLDPLHHEVPRLVPYGPWDDLDEADLEDWDWLDALPEEYRETLIQQSFLTQHHNQQQRSSGASMLLRQQHPSLILPSRQGSGDRPRSNNNNLPGRSAFSMAASQHSVPMPLHKRLAELAALNRSGTGSGALSGDSGSGGSTGPRRSQPSWLVDLRMRSVVSRSSSSQMAIRRAGSRTGPSMLIAPLISNSNAYDSDGSPSRRSRILEASASSSSWPPRTQSLDGERFAHAAAGSDHSTWVVSSAPQGTAGTDLAGAGPTGPVAYPAAGLMGGHPQQALQPLMESSGRSEDSSSGGSGEHHSNPVHMNAVAAAMAASPLVAGMPGLDGSLSSEMPSLLPSAAPSGETGYQHGQNSHLPTQVTDCAPSFGIFTMKDMVAGLGGKESEEQHEAARTAAPAAGAAAPVVRKSGKVPSWSDFAPAADPPADGGPPSTGYKLYGSSTGFRPNALPMLSVASNTSMHSPMVGGLGSDGSVGTPGTATPGTATPGTATRAASRMTSLATATMLGAASMRSDASGPTTSIASPASGMTSRKTSTMNRPASQRQTQEAVQLFKRTSTRYAYPAGPDSAQGGPGTPGGNETDTTTTAGTSLQPSNQPSGVMTNQQRPPEYMRSSSLGHSSLHQETIIPLLLQGKLEELSKALEQARGSAPHSPRNISAPVSPRRLSAPGSNSPVLRPAASDERSSQQNTTAPSYTQEDLAREQKRLMKMLYYGHQQQRKAAALEGGAGSKESNAPPPASLDLASSAPTPASRQDTIASSPGQNWMPSASAMSSLRQSLANAGSSGSFSDAGGGSVGGRTKSNGAGGGRRNRLALPLKDHPVDEETADETTGLMTDYEPFIADSPDGPGVRVNGDWRDGPAASGHSLIVELLARPGSLLKAGDVVDQQLTEEVVADVNARVERLKASRQSLTWLLWRALRRPLVAFLACSMPMIERRQELHYNKLFAVLLPLVGPGLGALYAGWWIPLPPDSAAGDSDLDPWSPEALRMYFICCGVTSLLVALMWRKDGLLQGPVLGVCTVLCFFGSMLWMNVAADELVGLLVAVGHVLELPAALLGATVLAWGNSLSDAVSNLTMARDGYPTMAITACFASPLFILLAGVACTLSVGAMSGPMPMPQDLPTLVLYGTSTLNMIMWAVAIPFIFKFKLDRRITYLGCGFYALFQIGYVVMILTMGSPEDG